MKRLLRSLFGDRDAEERIRAALRSVPVHERTGFRIASEAGVLSGTLYSFLARWERQGLIQRRREPDGRWLYLLADECAP